MKVGSSQGELGKRSTEIHAEGSELPSKLEGFPQITEHNGGGTSPEMVPGE